MAETNTPQPEPAERYNRDGFGILDGNKVISFLRDDLDELLALANSVPALREQVRERGEAMKDALAIIKTLDGGKVFWNEYLRLAKYHQ